MWQLCSFDRVTGCAQDDELDFAEQQKQAAIQHKQQWEHDSAEKQRLLKMQDNHHQFQQQIVSRRQGEFEELQVCLQHLSVAVTLASRAALVAAHMLSHSQDG